MSELLFAVTANDKIISDGKRGLWRFYDRSEAEYAAKNWPLAVEAREKGMRVKVSQRMFRTAGADYNGRNESANGWIKRTRVLETEWFEDNDAAPCINEQIPSTVRVPETCRIAAGLVLNVTAHETSECPSCSRPVKHLKLGSALAVALCPIERDFIFYPLPFIKG